MCILPAFPAGDIAYKNCNLTMFLKTSWGYLKNHWTNTRLVCTHYNAIFMRDPNVGMKIWILTFLKNLTCFLQLTSMLRRLKENTWRALPCFKYVCIADLLNVRREICKHHEWIDNWQAGTSFIALYGWYLWKGVGKWLNLWVEF